MLAQPSGRGFQAAEGCRAEIAQTAEPDFENHPSMPSCSDASRRTKIAIIRPLASTRRPSRSLLPVSRVTGCRTITSRCCDACHG